MNLTVEVWNVTGITPSLGIGIPCPETLTLNTRTRKLQDVEIATLLNRPRFVIWKVEHICQTIIEI